MNWVGDVFWNRYKRVFVKPPLWIEGVWVVWTVVALCAAGMMLWDWEIPVIKTIAIWEALAFVAFEAFGVYAGTKKKYGLTYSEFVWYNMPWLPVKLAWTTLLVWMCALYLHPLLAVVLAIWLFPHFIMRGR